jgi:hypothetical protein
MDKPLGSCDSSGDAASRGVGWLLRAQLDGVVREPLPPRWVELMNCLDDKARLKAELRFGDEGVPLKN